MRRKLTFLTAMAFSICWLQSANAQSVVINFVPDATFNGSPNENTDFASGSTLTTAGGAGTNIISTGITVDDSATTFPNLADGRGTFAPFTLSGTDASGNAVAGTFTVSITATDSTGATILRGGVGAFGAGTGNFITIDDVTLTNVSGDDVFQFDGFTGAFFGSTEGTNDMGSIEGVTVTPVAAGNLIGGTGEEILFADVAGVDSLLTSVDLGNVAGTIALNGVTAQFSVVGAAVPEPSSLAILGLGGIALISRRRR